MERRKELLVRAYLVMIVFVLLTCVILFRVFRVSVIEGDKWRGKASLNVQMKEVDADRGDIYADDYSVMATSLQFFEIRMDMTRAPESVFRGEVDSLAYMLSTTIRNDLSQSKWKERLVEERRKGNGYFLLAKGLDVEEVEQVRKFPILRRGRYGGGRREIRYSKRSRPFKQLARRTIGEDRENSQKIGLEGYYDRFLKGPFANRLMRRISSTSDQWVPVYDFGEYDIQRGDDILTTINVDMQDVVHNALNDQLIKSDARAGVAILMEVESGAIKAISNLRRIDSLEYREVYNDAIGTSSEPGSTFKLATVLALLEDGLAEEDDKVKVNGGKHKFYDKWMYDSEPHNRMEVTMKEAFEISSNVGIGLIAHKTYNKDVSGRMKFVDRLKRFGLLNETGVELNGEPEPYIKNPKKDKKRWYGTTIPWMAHGYELQLTPLQILNFYNAVANKGRLMKPMLVSKILSENEVKKEFRPIVLKDKIARDENLLKVRDMMEGVVESGTGKRLQSDIVSIAGKTGTTSVNYSAKNEKKKYNASFAGYFPASAPKYSMIVVVYEPEGAYYGASVAGPVFKKIAESVMKNESSRRVSDIAESGMKKMPGKHSGYSEDFENIFEYVGVDYKRKTDKRWVKVDPFENKMLVENGGVGNEKVPDVRGMGPRDAVYVLENLGMRVNVNGVGKVVAQNIRPGTRLNGQEIEIRLN